MGLILTIIAVTLSILTLWMGFAYTLITRLFTFRFKALNKYFHDIALAIDQLGNVVMRDLFNQILITSKSGNKFGDEDEVISSVLGKNQEYNTLSSLGKVVVKILDFIDPNHSLNSIEQRKKQSN